MRPSRVTCVASIIIRPAPLYDRCPRWIRCQSFMLPSSAWYWHIGETTMRFGSVMPPSWRGVKSFADMAAILGGGDLDAPLGERNLQCPGERRRARLVAVDAQRLGRHRHALAGEAGGTTLLAHAERLLHRPRRILDHAAGLVARRERAFVGVAAVG